MKVTLISLALLCLAPVVSIATAAPHDFDAEHCTYKGIPLYGKVQIVKEGEDFKINVVDYMPDIRVKPIKETPESCGEWQEVHENPDFKVKLQSKDADVRVKFVKFMPGI